jgi:hypothetical protein
MVLTTVVLVVGLLTSISKSTGPNGRGAVDLNMVIHNSQ